MNSGYDGKKEGDKSVMDDASPKYGKIIPFPSDPCLERDLKRVSGLSDTVDGLGEVLRRIRQLNTNN